MKIVNGDTNLRKENDLNHILEMLVGDFMNPLYFIESDSTSTTEVTMASLDSEYIYRDLFLWSILTHRLEIANIVLGHMKNRICSALIASKILKALSYYAPDEESNTTLITEANQFEVHAIEFMQYAYDSNKELAYELIVREIPLYGSVTCLQMAIAAHNKKFLHQDASLAVLAKIWYDKVDTAQQRFGLFLHLLTFGIGQILTSILQQNTKTPSKYVSNRDS